MRQVFAETRRNPGKLNISSRKLLETPIIQRTFTFLPLALCSSTFSCSPLHLPLHSNHLSPFRPVSSALSLSLWSFPIYFPTKHSTLGLSHCLFSFAMSPLRLLDSVHTPATHHHFFFQLAAVWTRLVYVCGSDKQGGRCEKTKICAFFFYTLCCGQDTCSLLQRRRCKR